MQDHWLRVAPPSYILQAAELGYKGSEPGADGLGQDVIEDPDQLMLALGQIPGGSVTGA